jgi:predicted nucleotidyltransferase
MLHPVTTGTPGPPAPRLASIRTRWLTAATASLRADPAVLGAALVGSLGAGRADDWSDIDLLIVVDDASLDEHAAPQRLTGVPGTLALACDVRHNAPRGARAASEQYIIDGLPLRVDRYLYPASSAAWPADSAVLLDRRGISRLSLTFSENMDAVEHEQPAPRDPAGRRTLEAALIPVAGKYIARRSPDTAQLITLAGGSRTPGASWADHLATLRQLLDGHAATGTGTPESIAATHAYLDIVAATLG